MTATQDGILWRLARLHPGWMAVPVACAFILNGLAYFFAEREGGAGEAGSLVASLPIFALACGYAFLVTALVSGRFHSTGPRRLRGPTIGLVVVFTCLLAMPLFVVLGGIFGVPLKAGSWPEQAMISAWGTFVVSGYYLMIRASIDLVAAERGFGGGTGRKIGTFLLLFFWVFGVFFIQARLRRLVRKFAAGGLVRLPMEKLELVESTSGRLALVLTEDVGGEGFEAYGEELINRLDGHILKKADLPNGVVWKVEIEGSNLRLLVDESLNRISLEACEDSAELLLSKLQKWFAPSA